MEYCRVRECTLPKSKLNPHLVPFPLSCPFFALPELRNPFSLLPSSIPLSSIFLLFFSSSLSSFVLLFSPLFIFINLLIPVFSARIICSSRRVLFFVFLSPHLHRFFCPPIRLNPSCLSTFLILPTFHPGGEFPPQLGKLPTCQFIHHVVAHL